jgi:hypothetical protein
MPACIYGIGRIIARRESNPVLYNHVSNNTALFILKFKIVKNLRLLSLLALATGFATIIGCKKGDTGPAGPAGPDSVQYSAWKTLAMTYTAKDSNGDSVFTETITAPAITQAILAKGSVLGYLVVSDPLSGDSSIISASLAFNEFFAVGKIDLVSYGVDFSGYDYRYVIIPGKIATSSISGSIKTYTIDQLKAMNYSTLTGVLNIPAKGSSLKLNASN